MSDTRVLVCATYFRPNAINTSRNQYSYRMWKIWHISIMINSLQHITILHTHKIKCLHNIYFHI